MIIEIDDLELDQNDARFTTMNPYCDTVKAKNLSVDPISLLVFRLENSELLEGTINGSRLAAAKSVSKSRSPLLNQKR